MNWISALSVPLAITGVFLLFRLFFPSKEADAPVRPFEPAERKRYQVAHLLSTLAFPVLVGVLGWLISMLLPHLRFGLDAGPDLIFAGLPGPTAWILAGVFAGMGLAIVVLDRLEALFLKGDVGRLRQFQSHAYGFNAAKVRSFLLTFTLSAGLLFTALMLDWRFLVRKDRVVLDGFMSITESVYPYGKMQALFTAPSFVAPNGDTVARREYAVLMEDGSGFNSLDLPGVTPQNRDSIFTLIGLLSGRSLTEKAVLERDDLR